jgi:cell cycle arrest protein BUB3
VQTTRVYDVAANAPRAKFDHRAAILAGCWGASGTHAYVGGLETRVCECVAHELFGRHDSYWHA